jgi:hypothetical protein
MDALQQERVSRFVRMGSITFIYPYRVCAIFLPHVVLGGRLIWQITASFYEIGPKDMLWFLNGTKEEHMRQIEEFYDTVRLPRSEQRSQSLDNL